MPKETLESLQSTQPLEHKPTNWTKTILTAVLGFGILASVIYWYRAQPAANEIGQWKTYTNTKYGYSVKYPNNLTPKEEPASNVFLTRTNFWDTVNDTVVFGIEIREAILTTAVEDIKNDYQKSSVIMELQREDKIVHQGYEGYQLEYESEATLGVDVTIIINNGTYSYLVRSDKDMVEQTLSTFKFLN